MTGHGPIMECLREVGYRLTPQRMLISDSFITFATTAGFVSSRWRREVYVIAGLLAAVFSLVVCPVFLFHASGFLPDLDPLFPLDRWAGRLAPPRRRATLSAV